MQSASFTRRIGFGLAMALALASGPALAQRDPAYAAARSAGQVGEKPDGYLQALGGGSGVDSMVDDLNIKRRAAYFEQARAEAVPVDQVAFVAGCRNVLRTVPGEKYQTPDGSWETRTAAAPQRDSRCP